MDAKERVVDVVDLLDESSVERSVKWFVKKMEDR